jgi:hypothetical protein
MKAGIVILLTCTPDRPMGCVSFCDGPSGVWRMLQHSPTPSASELLGAREFTLTGVRLAVGILGKGRRRG